MFKKSILTYCILFLFMFFTATTFVNPVFAKSTKESENNKSVSKNSKEPPSKVKESSAKSKVKGKGKEVTFSGDPKSQKSVQSQKPIEKRPKGEKSPKSPKTVKTTVVPKIPNEVTPVAPRGSIGTALGLNRKADDLNLKSSVSIVVDQQTQDILYEKNPRVVLPIASITKLLTAMTMLDANQPMDEILTINDEDAAIYNHSRLVKGTELPRREALLLALMSSENRAAYTLGRNYPGGIHVFMAALNRKAKEVGMLHSSFEDPTGLTSKNVSTAEDLALLVDAAYKYPLIKEFSTTPNHTKLINGREQVFLNSNRLVRSGDMQIGLQKTGYISEAGRCLVMQATVNNRPVIMVFLDSMGSLSRFADAVRVKEWLEESETIKPLRKLVAVP